MKIKMRKIAVITAAVTLSFPLIASAQRPREACKEDARSFCSDVQPGGGRIINCLQDHYNEISQTCYDTLQKMEKLKQARSGGNNNEPPPPPNEGDNNMPPPENGSNGEPPPPPQN